MKSRSTAFVALGCVGFVASAPAFAQTVAAQGEPTRLEGVTVTDSAVQDEYRTEAVQLPQVTAPLLDTPRTVNVVTQEVLEDTASFSLQQALRTVPGITLGAGEGGTASADIPLIRGVDATGDTFVDGARDVGSQTREVFAVERIEVYKGPNSALGGRGAAAGAINIVSKLPQAGNFASAQATVGTSEFQRVTADVNAEVADGLAVRVQGLWHDAEVAGRDYIRDDRWGVAPSIAFGVGTPITATLSYYHFETKGVPDYGLPLTSTGQLPDGRREPADVNYSNFYGLLSRDFQETAVDSASFLFRGDLGGGWSLSNTLRYSRARNNYIVTNPDDSRGNVANGLVWRSSKNRNSTNESLVGNVVLGGVFDTGGIGHSLAVGAEVTKSDTENFSYTIASGDGTCVAAQLALFNCTSLNDPNPNDPWAGSVVPGTTPATATVEDVSLYAADTITILPQLLLNGAVRWTSYEARGTGTVRGTPFSGRVSDDFWSFQGGVVFKPTENTSLYASYGDAKNPPGSDVGEGANNIGTANSNYDPQTTENYEVGAKAELFGGDLLLTGALFQIDRGNIIDNDPIAGPIPVAARARLRGFELGASGRAGPLLLLAGYTYVDSDLRDGSANDGNALPNTPEHNLAVTATYEVTPRFSLGGGAYAASERFADAANLIRADGYVRFDANAAYEISDRIGLRLNVQNVADERYIAKLRNPHFAVPASGRQALLTLAVRY